MSTPGYTEVNRSLQKWQGEIARYDKEKTEARHSAEAARERYEHLELENDQFHFTEAGFGLAIAMFAVASLAASRMLFGLGVFFGAWGVVTGLAGFLGWTIRPGVSIFG